MFSAFCKHFLAGLLNFFFVLITVLSSTEAAYDMTEERSYKRKETLSLKKKSIQKYEKILKKTHKGEQILNFKHFLMLKYPYTMIGK